MYVEELRWSSAARWGLVAVAALPIPSCITALLAAPPRAGRALALVPLLGVAALVAGILVAFGRLRVVVDETALTVGVGPFWAAGFGPFRERLPLARIAACEPATYRRLEYGGWGVRSSLFHPRRRATLCNVMGDGGRAVQVVLLDDRRRVLFSLRDPAAVCRALRALRADRHHPPPRPA